ncbi:MAG TPA: T9SS type A sorting domain-containing protein [Chitinophagaceae bacterium]|nr:T9SS type A sorting domain-containing protein [Chitinophagaceae bacterium]
MKIYCTIILCLLFGNAMAQGKFGGGIGDGFAVSQLSMILPINLTSFNVSVQGNRAQISWTAIAHNISSFTLEVSDDGSRFQPLAQKTVVNSIAPVQYGYTDGPRTGLWYYRLKWTEPDGHPAYSQIIPGLFTAMQQLLVKYDGYSDRLTIIKPASSLEVELYSADGRLLKVARSNQSVYHLSLRKLTAGLYVIRLRGSSLSARFVKLRD